MSGGEAHGAALGNADPRLLPGGPRSLSTTTPAGVDQKLRSKVHRVAGCPTSLSPTAFPPQGERRNGGDERDGQRLA